MISKRIFPTFIIPFLLLNFSCNEKKTESISCPISEEEKLLIQQKQEEERLLAEQKAIQEKKDAAIQNYINSFSDEVAVSQLFLVNIEGNKKFVPVEKTSEGKPLVPGGCLMFSYNIGETAEQTFNFTKSISDFYVQNQNIPPYIAIDQEGGDVNRLRGMTSVLWSQKKVSERFSVENAKKLYSEQAKQMRSLGINMNLAPVVEVEDSSNSEFLGTRTFGILEKTLSYGKSEIEGFEENGIATVLKHFPGNSSTDPHLGLPKIKVAAADIENYIASFKKLLPYSSAVLMSHAIVEEVGDEHSLQTENVPACLSYRWVSEILRNSCLFDGLIISDDIFMGALAKNGYPPEVAVVQAIASGVNIIMLSEKKFGSVAKILLEESKKNKIIKEKIEDSVKRVVEYKIKAGILDLVELKNENNELNFEVKVAEKVEFDSQKFTEAKKAGMKLYE